MIFDDFSDLKNVKWLAKCVNFVIAEIYDAKIPKNMCEIRYIQKFEKNLKNLFFRNVFISHKIEFEKSAI